MAHLWPIMAHLWLINMRVYLFHGDFPGRAIGHNQSALVNPVPVVPGQRGYGATLPKPFPKATAPMLVAKSWVFNASKLL